jgi:hypothetical protein
MQAAGFYAFNVILGLLLPVALAVEAALPWWTGLIGGLALLGVALQIATCRHPNPTLRPAQFDRHGRRRPPHWHCEDCGRTWPGARLRA